MSLLSVVTTKYSTLSRASVKLPKKLKIAVLLRLKSAPSRFHLNATASSIQLSDSQEIPIRVKQAQNGTKKLVTASQCRKFLMKSAHAWSNAVVEFTGTNSHAVAKKVSTILWRNQQTPYVVSLKFARLVSCGTRIFVCVKRTACLPLTCHPSAQRSRNAKTATFGIQPLARASFQNFLSAPTLAPKVKLSTR